MISTILLKRIVYDHDCTIVWRVSRNFHMNVMLTTFLSSYFMTNFLPSHLNLLELDWYSFCCIVCCCFWWQIVLYVCLAVIIVTLNIPLISSTNTETWFKSSSIRESFLKMSTLTDKWTIRTMWLPRFFLSNQSS